MDRLEWEDEARHATAQRKGRGGRGGGGGHWPGEVDCSACGWCLRVRFTHSPPPAPSNPSWRRVGGIPFTSPFLCNTNQTSAENLTTTTTTIWCLALEDNDR